MDRIELIATLAATLAAGHLSGYVAGSGGRSGFWPREDVIDGCIEAATMILDQVTSRETGKS